MGGAKRVLARHDWREGTEECMLGNHGTVESSVPNVSEALMEAEFEGLRGAIKGRTLSAMTRRSVPLV